MAVALGSLLTALYVGWEVGGDVRSLTWIWGQLGEQQTEDVLGRLEHDGWRVVHDIPREHGNYDHIAIGPPGLFLLDSCRGHSRITSGRLRTLASSSSSRSTG
jgi:hypothetical protein